MIQRMNKIERVDGVLRGEEVDRPPLSLWYHFGVQHGNGEGFARTTLEFFEHYDFDWLKVMNDYFYPLPDGLETVASKDDLRRLAAFDVEKSEWRHQFKALRLIYGTLENKARFLDTVFDPWQTMQRSLAGERLGQLMEDEPGALLEALDVVTENLLAYCKLSLGLGAAGIYLSVPAAAEIMSREQYLRFCKPFVVRLLEGIRELGPMNTAHIHGKRLFFDDVLDLPVPVLSWYDRHEGCPSLAEVKDRFPGCVMGGIDQTFLTRHTRRFIREHVREALELGGRSRFFLAGGCSIDTWADPAAVRTVVETVQTGG
jgi:uroporphyrinogen decarboxylase